MKVKWMAKERFLCDKILTISIIKPLVVLTWCWSLRPAPTIHSHVNYPQITQKYNVHKSCENTWTLIFPFYSWVLWGSSGLKKKSNMLQVYADVYFLVIFIGGKQLVGKYLLFSLASESKQDFHSVVAKMTFHKLLVDWGLRKPPPPIPATPVGGGGLLHSSIWSSQHPAQSHTECSPWKPWPSTSQGVAVPTVFEKGEVGWETLFP